MYTGVAAVPGTMMVEGTGKMGQERASEYGIRAMHGTPSIASDGHRRGDPEVDPKAPTRNLWQSSVFLSRPQKRFAWHDVCVYVRAVLGYPRPDVACQGV